MGFSYQYKLLKHYLIPRNKRTPALHSSTFSTSLVVILTSFPDNKYLEHTLLLVGFSLFVFKLSLRSPATDMFHHHKVSALLLIFTCIVVFHSPCFPLICFFPKGNQSPRPSWKRMFCFYHFVQSHVFIY